MHDTDRADPVQRDSVYVAPQISEQTNKQTNKETIDTDIKTLTVESQPVLVGVSKSPQSLPRLVLLFVVQCHQHQE